MDYDFSVVCEDQLDKLAKRLKSLNKAFIKEYKIGLNVINSPSANEKRSEITNAVEDLLSDQVNKAVIFYTETLNKVQRELKKYL